MIAKLPVVALFIVIIFWVSLGVKDKGTLIALVLAMGVGVLLKILWDQQGGK